MNALASLHPGPGSARYALVGSGGHARSIVAAAAAIGWSPWVVIEREGSGIGRELAMGEAGVVPVVEEGGITPVADGWPVVVGIGVRPRSGEPGTAIRKGVFHRYREAGWVHLTIVDPTTILRGSVTIGDGAQVLAGAIVQPGSVIGDGAVVNTGARVDHDCRIGSCAFIGPGAILCGGVVIGESALVGAGAVLLPGASVPDGGLVPAGSTYGRKQGPSPVDGQPVAPVV